MADDNAPFGGNALVPGNLGAMSPQMLATYLAVERERTRQHFTPSHSWADIPAGILEGLAENKERDQLMRTIAGMSGGAPADTVPSLPWDAGGNGNPKTTGAPPQIHDGTDYDYDTGATGGGDLLQKIGAHEIGPKDKAALEGGGKVFPYRDGRQVSIGFGSKAQPGDANGIDAGEAAKRLQRDVGLASNSVQAFVPNASRGWHDALTDLTYNTGAGWQKAGLGQAVKAGDWDTAKKIYPTYNKVADENGKLQTSQGLVSRRRDFLKDVDKNFGPSPVAAGGLSPGGTPTPGPQALPTPAASPGGPGSALTQPAPGAAPPTGAGAPAAALTNSSPPAGAAPSRSIPPEPNAVAQFRRDQARAQQLMRFPYGTPEHNEGIRLSSELQKRLEPIEFVDQNTGARYSGSPVAGWQPSMRPGALPPGAQKGAETAAEELAKARMAGPTEALKRGAAANDTIRSIDAMMALSNSPEGKNVTSGPFAKSALTFKQAVNNWFPGAFEDVPAAEAMDKLNAFLASGAVHELTSRGTQFDFKTFMANNPGLNQTPEGRALTADILKQMALQDREIGRRLRKDDNPGRNYDDIVDNVYAEKPIVPHLNGRAIYSTGAIPGYGAPEPPPPPPPPGPMQPGSQSFGNVQGALSALRGNPGGGPDLARALGTTNPIAQSVGVGDNPMVDPDVAKNFNKANAAGAAIGTAPLTLPALIKAAKASGHVVPPWIYALLGGEEVARRLRGE